MRGLMPGLGAAGLTRFPRLGQVLTSLEKKKRMRSSGEGELALGLLQGLYRLLDEKGTLYALKRSSAEKHKAMTLHSALAALKARDANGELMRVRYACHLLNSVAMGPMPVVLARRRTDAAGQVSLALDLTAEPEPECTYDLAVVLMRRMDKAQEYTRQLSQQVTEQFLPALDEVEHMELEVAGRRAELDAELAQLRALWTPDAASQQALERAKATILGTARNIHKQIAVSVDTFGSRYYALCKSDSDFDLHVRVRVPQKNPDKTHEWFVKRLVAGMRRNRAFTSVQWLARTRVPIVKFAFKAGRRTYEGDVSFNRGLGPAKTKMIGAYMRADPRVRTVLMILKHWGVERAITSSNALNSFGLTMMGLAFLIEQRVVPPLQLLATTQVTDDAWAELDALHASPQAISALYAAPDASVAQTRKQVPKCLATRAPLPDWACDGVRTYFLNDQQQLAQWRSPNRKSAYELAFELFRHYGARFDSVGCAVSPRLGSTSIRRSSLERLQAPMPQAVLEQPRQWDRRLRLLAIEDPFELELNCARLVPAEWVEGLRWEMRRAAAVMAGGSLARLFVRPSADIYCDASVWAPAYARLARLAQSPEDKRVFDPEVDVTAATTIPLFEREAKAAKR
ncbi:hypothetical protein H4S02_000047 [Coemansia sp. RSA 2611]|nr:hypothetical protein IWW54_000288 [Coemansia sp. RSA 2705]KAJ2322319.1 hypothetical protein IWW52_000152 [Coemansia sp. RSA 2704]KAJ2323180.1 hypothetical protein IWW51_003884 [Coemansia sp. RSA 2702]KAJ2393685.1 hypothetical protein H4S02_000047 [Coemansia sp. RSA 2611]